MKRCIELIRVSTAGQADSDRASIPSQRTINARTAKAHGLTIIDSIEIADVSGAAVLLTPEIQKLIITMNDPEIHGVVAREFSRLMRPENFSDYALLQAFADTATLLYLPEGPLDFASKTGRLMGTIRAAIAGMERTEILERIWNAKESKRNAGGFAQSRICLPFGVTYGDVWSYNGDAPRVAEAFRLVLGGTVSYTTIGRQVGVEAYNLRNILRNPIYTGWRVIDKKRDLSAAGKYPTKDGRQGDRRKIQRAPEDVIRVKVMEPLISESDFQKVQRILDLKRQNSWRHIEGYEHRWTYNGYLNCECGALIYTKFRRRDYYVCKVRCGASYMRRDRLEPMLDKLFTHDLTRPRFLQKIVRAMKQQEPTGSGGDRLAEQIKALEAKRQRVLSAFYDGVIDVAERESKLAEISKSRRVLIGMAERERPVPQVTVDALAEVFAPFMEFDLLNRNDKRRLLNTITPSIIAANYHVSGLWMASGFVSDLIPTDMSFPDAAGLTGRLWLEMPAAA